MYEGRTAAEAGITFGQFSDKYRSLRSQRLTSHAGHENMGIVEETGTGVTLLKKGDRVVMPFNVADGRCRNCEQGKTAFCTGVNPGFAGGAYGMLMNSSCVPDLGTDRWQAMSPWALIEVDRRSTSRSPTPTSTL